MLTDMKIRTAKTGKKQTKQFDFNGLYLLISPNGGNIGASSTVSIARKNFLPLEHTLKYPLPKLDNAVMMPESYLPMGYFDPGAVKKAQKASRADSDANSFEVVAREWHKKNKESWSSSHANVTITRLERDIFPWMGKRPISEIEPPEVLAVLQRIESRGAAETAHRMKIVYGQVFRYAVATGRSKRDQTADLKGALKPVISKHMAALTDPKRGCRTSASDRRLQGLICRQMRP